MLIDVFFGRRIDERSKKVQNLSFIQVYLMKFYYDLVSVSIYTVLVYCVFGVMFFILSGMGINEFPNITQPFFFLLKIDSFTDLQLTLLKVYTFRLILMVLYNTYYFISKFARSTFVRGKRTRSSKDMRVDFNSVLIIRLGYLLAKILLELYVIYYVTSHYDLSYFVSDNFFSIFGDSVLGIQFTLFFIVFFVLGIIVWHIFSVPLWFAKLRSFELRGNFIFSWLGVPLLVGSASRYFGLRNRKAGLKRKFTQMYHNTTDSSEEAFNLRFHTRVFYIYTFGFSYLVDALLYIVLGAPLLNDENAWRHIL